MREFKGMSTGGACRSYRVVQDWAQFPDHIDLGYTHGIEVDLDDNIYIFHTGKPSIVKMNREGHYLSSMGDEFEGGAHGFYLHREEGKESSFYVTDTSKELVVKLSLDGEHLLEIGTPELPNIYDADRRFIPTDVAVAPNGDIYIADGYGQSWIHQYSAQGDYIRSWGGKGAEPGQLNCPHGISIDRRGSDPVIYVADRGNHRIQIFTLEGQFIRLIDENMDMPCSFYYNGNELYFPDLHSRITIFDQLDQLITHLGEDQQAYKQAGWPNLEKSFYRPNKFSSPHGVCVDSEGSVYVAEWIKDGRITKLIRQSNVLEC